MLRGWVDGKVDHDSNKQDSLLHWPLVQSIYELVHCFVGSHHDSLRRKGSSMKKVADETAPEDRVFFAIYSSAMDEGARVAGGDFAVEGDIAAANPYYVLVGHPARDIRLLVQRPSRGFSKIFGSVSSLVPFLRPDKELLKLYLQGP